MNAKTQIATILFYIALAVFVIWFIKINIDGFNSIQPPLTPEQQQQSWEDYYDFKHGPRG